MKLIRTSICSLVLVLFYLSATCQSNRWLLSFNPLGLLEPKGALGAGIGVKLNKQVELWSETSLLRTVIYAGDSSLTGIRQIVQIKYFPHGYPDFFIAAEVRYKTYQYRVGGEFFNPAITQYLENYMYTVQRHFLGEALQLGFRRTLKEDMGLYVEFTAGLGIKQYVFREKGLPAGYRHTNVDNGLEDGITPAGVYAPGSIRLIWAFGEKL
ncbi:MAG TPA: hypothetical protein VHD83_01080 [Puia sp.]|nr:hypothetical protein [Puia sp.]